MSKKWRKYKFLLLSFLGSVLLSIAFATPGLTHWADLAVADILVGKTETQITLTFPTGLVASADDNRDGQLSPDEVRIHQVELQNFLRGRIRLTDGEKHNGDLTVKPSDMSALPSNLKATAGTHSTLLLVYTWPKAVQGLKINYNLFLPGVPTARCLATISYPGQVQNFIFSPENRQLSLMPGSAWLAAGSLMAIAGSFVWGAMHAMSPGHGKTIVGAYLAGSRATAQHALFLGLTTTITHTAGVFALGLVTLFASHYIVPEQLYPWLSFLSGLMVVSIGLNLFISRMSRSRWFQRSPFKHSHTGNPSHDHHHHHDHAHDHPHHHHEDSHADHSHLHTDHHHHHDHAHDHPLHHHHHHEDSHADHSHLHTDHHHHHHEGSHAGHSHLPPGADGSPLTWRSLLVLGISGGLVPCPSALVLLLSTIALGRVGFGLLLVLVFSLGLAATLTGLGLLLVGARRLFERVPTQIRLVRILPAVSALFVTLLGLGITTQALMQIGLVKP